VVFEVLFGTEEQWDAFRALPIVRAALDAVPDPVSGLTWAPEPPLRIYRGDDRLQGFGAEMRRSVPYRPDHWSTT
jgi:hypothetical protein